jgi:hypothetical protein
MKTNIFYFQFIITTLVVLLLFQASALYAQEQNEYSQIDTVKICDMPQSKTFIFKVVTSEINSEYNKELITDIYIYNLPNETFLQIIKDTSTLNFSGGEVDYVDINIDGYLDIDINLGYYNLIASHTFWLFDPKDNKFYYSGEFSRLNDYYVDVDEKIIESNELSLGGSGGYSQKFKVENDSLILIETSFGNYYEYEKTKLINGMLKTVEKVEEGWETDSNDNQLIVLSHYKLIEDTLLIIEKEWLTELNEKITNDTSSDDIYDCGPWGWCLKYLKKEIYSYKKNESVKLIKNTEKYQVLNDEWVKVVEFVE